MTEPEAYTAIDHRFSLRRFLIGSDNSPLYLNSQPALLNPDELNHAQAAARLGLANAFGGYAEYGPNRKLSFYPEASIEPTLPLPTQQQFIQAKEKEIVLVDFTTQPPTLTR